MCVFLVRDTIETGQFYLTWLFNFFSNSMIKESSWKSFLSSSPQFQITNNSLQKHWHYFAFWWTQCCCKGRREPHRGARSRGPLLAFSSCLQSANSNPGNGTRLIRVEPKLHLSQHSARRKPGADGCGRVQEWKKHKIVTDKASSHHYFGASKLLKPQKASIGLTLERFPPAGLPPHNSFWAYWNFHLNL